MTLSFMRPVRETDFPAIHALAQQAGGGMTNLPADEATLRAKIHASAESFAKGAAKPDGEFYMLVLDRGGVASGTAAVFASVGKLTGFVNYKINREFYFSVSLNKRFQRDVLVPTHDFTDCAEVGSLFIAESERGSGLGKLLARSRYMFIAQSPNVVADRICSEMRGWRAPDGEQPFWNAVGRRFFGMGFEEADAYNAAYGNQFIEDLMPRYPIYVDMLPKDARECLGKPHDSAIGAYKMLLEEGFAFNNYIDVFDGGPLVDAQTKRLRTVRKSRVYTVSDIVASVEGEESLLAAGAVSTFRACKAPAKIEGESIALRTDAAKALGVGRGDKVRWAKWE
jgi:arginine N-succinyltransferase